MTLEDSQEGAGSLFVGQVCVDARGGKKALYGPSESSKRPLKLLCQVARVVACGWKVKAQVGGKAPSTNSTALPIHTFPNTPVSPQYAAKPLMPTLAYLFVGLRPTEA